MKILFLDIDGVLNSQRSFAAFQHREKRNLPSAKDSQLAYFYKITTRTLDKVAVGLVNRVVKETGAKVVLTSTHRKHFLKRDGVHEEFCILDIQIYLKALGLKIDMIDATPVTARGHRGTEIKQWLDSRKDVEAYAIIDDDSDMLQEQLPFFVKTPGSDGMSFENYRDLRKILTGEKDA